jgi:Xaa-Pro aminopeptidase
MVLTDGEQARYRALGRDAAEAMTEALRAAPPDWTEYELAGGRRAGPVAARHPAGAGAGRRRAAPAAVPPSDADRTTARRRAMLVFCARRHGLYANLTRFVSFGPRRTT